MSTYQELKGLKIKYLSSDTSGDRATEGEVFYNSTSSTVASHIAAGAWAAGAPMNTGRSAGMGSGTQTAALVAGGGLPSGSTATEEYNGSGWAAGGTIGTARGGGGSCGTQTASLIFAGTVGSPNSYQDKAESYDGSSWTEQPDINTARYNQVNGVGTSTAALYFGGYNGSNLNNTEEYDGSSWTNSGVYPTIARDFGGAGLQTAALGMGGYMPSPASATPGLSCTYDGSSWTNGPTMNTGRANLGTGGTQTAAIGAGGYRTPATAVTGVTETWDGTSWTETADLATARRSNAARNATNTAFLAFSGPGHNTANTEEFNVSINTITAGAWSSSNNVNTARRATKGAGIQTAAIIMGGYGPAFSNKTEEYDGTSWTEATNAPFAVYNAYGGGTQTAFIVTGGDLGPAINAETAEWDGSSWTTTNDHPAARNGASGTGTQTAIVSAGGSPHPTATTFYYDGSSWSNQSANLGTARYESINSSCGTQAAALLVAGAVNPNAPRDEVEEWNGTAWSEQNDIPTATRQLAISGIQTAALIHGGETQVSPSVVTASSLSYDGTNWSTSPALGTARRAHGGLGSGSTSTAALASSGHNGTANIATTEEFTGETSALATAKTIDFD